MPACVQYFILVLSKLLICKDVLPPFIVRGNSRHRVVRCHMPVSVRQVSGGSKI
jgi:hypothetical protein